MKRVLGITLTILLSAVFVQPAFAEEAESTIALRHHLDLPQPVVYHDNNETNIEAFLLGYHFTLLELGNRVGLGGLGTGFGLRKISMEGEDDDLDFKFYLTIPAVDMCLSKNGCGTGDDDADFEFSTKVLYEVTAGYWGFAGLFAIGW